MKFFLPFTIVAAILFLMALLAVSSESAQRWYRFGGLSIQPAEMAKLAVVLAMARYLAFRKLNYENFSWVFVLFVLVAVPAGLVLIQPDLGSSLVFFALFFGILIWTGLPLNRVLLIITPILSMLAAIHWISWAYLFPLAAPASLPIQTTHLAGLSIFYAQFGIWHDDPSSLE